MKFFKLALEMVVIIILIPLVLIAYSVGFAYHIVKIGYYLGKEQSIKTTNEAWEMKIKKDER